jgi:hypothetical protein
MNEHIYNQIYSYLICLNKSMKSTIKLLQRILINGRKMRDKFFAEYSYKTKYTALVMKPFWVLRSPQGENGEIHLWKATPTA